MHNDYTYIIDEESLIHLSVSSAYNNAWSTGGIQSIVFVQMIECMTFRDALFYAKGTYILGLQNVLYKLLISWKNCIMTID